MSYGTITACVGPNGSGKTLAAIVEAVIPSWQNDRPVRANVHLYPERLGFDPDLALPLNAGRDLLEAEHCTILLDEITAVFPSRSFASLPPELQRVLNQLRKKDVDVIWTAPNWSRCDVILREVTQEVIVCKSMFRERWLRNPDGLVRNEDGKRIRRGLRWPANKLFRFVTYDAQEYDEYQDRANTTGFRPKRNRWYYRPRHRAQWAYESLEPVALFDHLDDIGSCIQCNRKRKTQYCTCGTAAGGAGGETQRESVFDPAFVP